MSDLVQATTLLGAAQRDLKALLAMRDADLFSDEIFGFHVQQVAEKGLKAWLAALGEVYPYTHDINLLLGKLQKRGCDVSAYEEFVEYTAFAGQIRYVGLDNDVDPIDRKEIISHVQELYDRVSVIVKALKETK